MIENFEHKGLWYLPNNPERKIHGVLKYDYINDINILELLGSFFEFSDYETQEIILGITTEYKEITLVDCQFHSSSGISSKDSNNKPIFCDINLFTLNYRINTILIGYKIYKKQDIKFQKVYARIFNLDEWIGANGFSENKECKESFYSINYNFPKPIKINESLELEINFSSNFPIVSRFNNRISLHQKTFLILESKKYLTFDELIYLIQKFIYFLTTSIQTPIRIESLQFFSDKFSNINKESEIPINLYKIIDNKLKFDNRKQDYEMLFTYSDISNNFENIISKWYSNYEKFESPFNLILRHFYHSEYYLEPLFINAAQAAETFHRRLDRNNEIIKYEQDYEFNIKLIEVINNTPEHLKNWVKSQISPPSHFFETRLTYLINEYSNSKLNEVIGVQTIFSKNITDSRNYYTHYNTRQKNNAKKDLELVKLYLRLRLLLICGFLIESGFNKQQLENWVAKKWFNMFRELE